MPAPVTPPAPLLGPIPLPDVFAEVAPLAAVDTSTEVDDNFGYEPLLVLDNPLGFYEATGGAIVAFGLPTPPTTPVIADQELTGEPDLAPPILGWTPSLQDGPILLELPNINVGANDIQLVQNLDGDFLDPMAIYAGAVQEVGHFDNPWLLLDIVDMEIDEENGIEEGLVHDEHDQIIPEADLTAIFASLEHIQGGNVAEAGS